MTSISLNFSKEHETHVFIERESHGTFVVIEQPDSAYDSNQSVWLSFRQCNELLKSLPKIMKEIEEQS